MSRARRDTLSPTQLEAARVVGRNGGRIERWVGGFWTYPGCTYTTTNAVVGRPCRVPIWWVPIQTVQALQRKGLLVEGHRPGLTLSATWEVDAARYVQQ